MTYHVPVLLKESVDALVTNPQGTYLDLTFGGGGHSKNILNQLNKDGRLIGFDQDADAERNVIKDERFSLEKANFRFFKNFLKYRNIEQVDGILADLGVSSHQFNVPERGFSFRFNGPLDMRMNTNAKLSAKVLLNNYENDELFKVLKEYGELRNAGRVTSLILKAREKKEICTTGDLKDLLSPILKPGKENKILAQIFQALRIEVNQEMQALHEMLLSTIDALKPGGRLVVITYHSLEDRPVKNFLKNGRITGECKKDLYGNRLSPFKLINKKVIIPTDEEIKINPRSRSAKLRIAERI